MHKLLWLVGCILMSSSVFSQSTDDAMLLEASANGTAREVPWFKGTIILSDETELKGFVRYNDWNGALAYKAEGVESRTFNSRNVMAFSFFDEEEDRYRIFYTFEYEHHVDNIRRPMFFEVLRDYGDFVVLIKTDPVNLKQKKRVYSFVVPDVVKKDSPMAFTKMVAIQIETVYLMNGEGVIKPYFRCKTKQDETISLDEPGDARERTKVLTPDLLKEFVTPQVYHTLTVYASTNNLRFEEKENLLEILEYYSQITGHNPR